MPITWPKMQHPHNKAMTRNQNQTSSLHQNHLHQARNPIIIVGAVRSGTTLLRLLLDHHPDIHFLGEFEAAVSQLKQPKQFVNLDWFAKWIAQDRQTLQYNFQLPEHAADYPAFIHNLTLQAAERSNKSHLGFTIHTNFHRCPDLWPDARYIHIIRDPRDVANSCVRMGWEGNVWQAANTWTHAQTKWNKLKNQITPDQFYQLTFESLLENPVEKLQQICSFLNIQYNPSMLEFHHDTTYAPIDASLANQWQRKLTPRQCELIELRCSPLMQQFGYTPTSTNPPPPNPLQQCHYYINHKLRRIHFNLKRFGLPLYLAWQCSKPLSINNPLRKRVHRRINQINAKHIK